MSTMKENEEQRLKVLQRYHILDSDAEQVFDDLTLLASHICDTPIALISLVDEKRQWFKSKVGIDVSETPRDIAFCAHAILQKNIFTVPDAMLDERFLRNPLVTSKPNIRFYAGVPLVTSEGHGLGALCVIDRKPRTLTPDQEQALEALSRQVMSQLELRCSIALRKSAEESLRASEERMQLVLNASNDGIWDHDLTTNNIFTSPRMAQLFGYGADELTHTFDEFKTMVHPDDWNSIASSLQQHIERNSRLDVEFRGRCKSGEYRWFRSRGTAVRDAQEKPQRVVGSSSDITERKLAEEALRESETRFRMMADAAPMLIWMCGPDKHCTHVNKSLLEFSGRTLEQELGSGWADIIHPDDVQRYFETYVRSFDARDKFMIECRMRRHDGEYRWLVDVGVPRFTEAGDFAGYIGSCIDITDRKNAEDEARDSREKLHAQKLQTIEQQRLVEIQQTQIQTLHEVTLTLMDRINNPLAIILMTFEVWQRDHRLPEEMLKHMETVRNAAYRISGALKDISTLDNYKTLETSFGRILDVYSKEERLIEA